MNPDKKAKLTLRPVLTLTAVIAALILLGGSSVQADSQPTLAILSPGGLFNPSTTVGNSFQLSFAVTNFQIVQPGLLGQGNQANQGHVLVFLDNSFYATRSTADSVQFQNLAPGNHTIMVQLVNNDNSALFPDASSTIRVTVSPFPAAFNFSAIQSAASSAATSAAAAKTSADSANTALATLGTNIQAANTGVQSVNSAVQGVSSAVNGISSSLKSTQSAQDANIASIQSTLSSSVNYSYASIGLSVITLIAVLYVVMKKK